MFWSFSNVQAYIGLSFCANMYMYEYVIELFRRPTRTVLHVCKRATAYLAMFRCNMNWGMPLYAMYL